MNEEIRREMTMTLAGHVWSPSPMLGEALILLLKQPIKPEDVAPYVKVLPLEESFRVADQYYVQEKL